jgi:phage baseplate assembly protein W
MSNELLFPFAMAPDGTIATTSVPANQVRQHVTALVSTTPGERVMQPKYGIDLPGNLFAGQQDITSSSLGQEVVQALALWEPSVQVTRTSPVYADGNVEGLVGVEVDYIPGAAQTTLATVNTATVATGGSVTEVIRNLS